MALRDAKGEPLSAGVVEWVLSSIPIRKDQVAAMAEAERTLTNEPMLVALRLHAAGLNVTDAAKASGYASHSEVARKAREFGFAPPDRETLGQEFRRLAGMCLNEILRRMEEDPESVPLSTMQICMGIATDKAAVAGAWVKGQGDADGDKAAAFIARLANAGANRISLDIEAGRGRTVLEAEVTREPRRLNGSGAA